MFFFYLFCNIKLNGGKMSFELKALTKSEKFKRAEKYLNKYILEIKRHFDLSDFQTFNLLQNVSHSLKKNNKKNFLKKLWINIKK